MNIKEQTEEMLLTEYCLNLFNDSERNFIVYHLDEHGINKWSCVTALNNSEASLKHKTKYPNHAIIWIKVGDYVR